MRQAPPVSVQCHGRGWRLGQAAVFGLAGATLAAWSVQHLVEAAIGSVAAPAAALAAFIGAFGLSLRLLRAGTTPLCWNGQQWLVGVEPQQVGLMLQTGSFVLLRLRAASGTTWLAIERTEAGAAWHGLLVALHATPGSAAGDAEGQVG